MKNLIKRIKTIGPIEIFILISVVMAIIFLVKFFGIKKDWVTIKVEVIPRNWAESYSPYGYRTPFWMSDKLNIGQLEKNSSGKVIAEVIDIEKYERGNEESEVYLIVKVKAQYNKVMGKYLFKGKPLDLGDAIELRLDNIHLFGQIIDKNYPLTSYKQKEIIIVGRWRAQDKWKISQVKSGDIMIDQGAGITIAEVLDIKIEPPTKNMIVLSGLENTGKIEMEDNINKKDAVITLKIKVHKQNNRWYFAGHQKIKIGEVIWVYTNNIDINSLEVQEIKEM